MSFIPKHLYSYIYSLYICHLHVRENSFSFSLVTCNICTSCLQQRIMLFKNVCQYSTSATWTTSNPSYLLSVLYIGFLLEMKWRFSPSKHSVICEKGNTKDHLQNGRRCWLMANTQKFLSLYLLMQRYSLFVLKMKSFWRPVLNWGMSSIRNYESSQAFPPLSPNAWHLSCPDLL